MTETLNPVKSYQQFIGGQWIDAASGETLDVENPATGEVVATVPASSGADVDRAVEAAATAFEIVVADDAPDPEPRPAQDRGHHRRQRRRARAARVEPDRQADRRRDRRDDDVVRPVPLLRRCLPGHGGPRGHRVPRGPHLDGPPRPGRRRGLDRALELPAVHGRVEARAGARDRQHRRPQAVCPHAAVRAAFRRARLGRAARGRPQRAVGLGRRDRRPPRRAPEGPHDLDHRRHRDRQAHRGDRGGHGEAAAPRAGRQGPGDRVRRRRCRAGGGDHQVGRLLEQRPGLHRGLPRDRRSGGVRQVRQRPLRPGEVDQVGQPGRRRRPRHGLTDRAGAGGQGRGHGRSRARREGRARRRWPSSGPPGRVLRADDHRQPRPRGARSSRTRCSGRS